MNIFSWLQLIFYMVVLIALAKPLGLYMSRVYQGERTFLDPVPATGRKIHLPPERCASGRGDELEDLCPRHAALQRPGTAGRVRFAAPAGLPAAQPAGLWGGYARLVLEHGRQLCHQHQLAGLRRRDHHELPDPDARPDRPEFRLGRHRHGHRHCHDPWHFAVTRPKPSAISGWT